jgi:hypothetical protein
LNSSTSFACAFPERDEAGHVPAGMRETRSNPGGHRVGHVQEDHRDLRGRRLRGAERLIFERHEQVRPSSD